MSSSVTSSRKYLQSLEAFSAGALNALLVASTNKNLARCTQEFIHGIETLGASANTRVSTDTIVQ
jgi:hypothetical protein